MGFESFRVELRPRHATFTEAVATVGRLPHARPDTDVLATAGSSYYTVEDGRHVVEIEVAPSPVRVSCRFTLCHPPTVDTAFLGLVRELARRLGGAELTGEGVTDHPGGESPEFAATLSAQIAARRSEWDAMFGNDRAAARTAEAFEAFVLPRCAPVAEPARVGMPTAAPPAPAVPAPSS